MKNNPQIEPRPEKAEPLIKRAMLYQLSYALTEKHCSTSTASAPQSAHHHISATAQQDFAFNGGVPAVSVREILAPCPVNRGPKTIVHPNRFCIAGNTAILFCREKSGVVFGVRIDREDLVRVLKLGVWRVADFGAGRNVCCLYCYTTSRVQGKKVTTYLHRLILDAPKGQQVDHRHGKTLDNRKAEIRIVSATLNQLNRNFAQSSSRSGIRGVRQTESGKFVARVCVNRKDKYLGTFDTPELASAAVKDFLIQQGAEYAAGGVK